MSENTDHRDNKVKTVLEEKKNLNVLTGGKNKTFSL